MFKVGIRFSVAAGVVFAFATCAAASDTKWQFSEFNDPENKGALTARLAYGVPETDNIQVTGVCDGRPSTGVKFSSLTLAADVGPDPKAGEAVDLRFTGGGFDHVAKGTIERPQSEEGIVGVHLELEHDDPLWQALQEKGQLDYFVPGYRASTLELTEGKDKISAFITACRSYAEAILGEGDGGGDASADTQASSNSTPEKDAFAAAKELGTADAWNAFLASYPTGFHADLARAYLKKLEQGAATPPPAAAPPPQTDAQALGPTMTGIMKAPSWGSLAAYPYPAKRSCSERASLRSLHYATPTKVSFVHYSGSRRDIHWIDYQGNARNYITIKPGQEVIVDTFVSHPWMVTDADGNCNEIILPRPVPTAVSFGSEPQKKPTSKKGCKAGYIVIEGKCIRKRDAASYCGPGYRLQGNKCVQGYQQPKPQKQLPSWQQQGIAHGCKPGLAWNAQEGCHEND